MSELGHRQAESLRGRLAATGEIGPAAVFTSMLARAVETAAILEPAIGAATADCELCELHPGECDGRLWDEWASAYPCWDDPDAVFSPGGESLRSFDRRVRRALERLCRPAGRSTVVVVGHSGFIEAASLALMRGPAFPEVRDFMIDGLHYSSLTEWRLLSDGRWLLVRYNDAAHLGDVGFASEGGVFR